MTEVFCDRWFDTEETSSVIEAVYYSSERRELFIQLVPRDDYPGIVAGYKGVPANIFTALEVLNSKRLNGEKWSSVGKYWNYFVKPYFEGLPTKDVDIFVPDDFSYSSL